MLNVVKPEHNPHAHHVVHHHVVFFSVEAFFGSLALELNTSELNAASGQPGAAWPNA